MAYYVLMTSLMQYWGQYCTVRTESSQCHCWPGRQSQILQLLQNIYASSRGGETGGRMGLGLHFYIENFAWIATTGCYTPGFWNSNYVEGKMRTNEALHILMDPLTGTTDNRVLAGALPPVLSKVPLSGAEKPFRNSIIGNFMVY